MHSDREVEILMRLERLQSSVDWLIGITRHEVHAMTQLDTSIQQLAARVNIEGTVVDSARTLIVGLADQIAQLRDQLGTDPVQAAAKLDQLQLQLKAQSDALAAAVSANTPTTGGGTTDPNAPNTGAAGTIARTGRPPAPAGSTDNGSTNGNETYPTKSEGQGDQGGAFVGDGTRTPQG